MSKKWVVGLIGAAAASAGAFYAYKKFFAPKAQEDDFDNDIDEFDFDEDEDDSREYVSLNIDPEEAKEAAEDAVDEAKDIIDDIKDEAKDAFEDVKDTLDDVKDDIKDAFDK